MDTAPQGIRRPRYHKRTLDRKLPMRMTIISLSAFSALLFCACATQDKYRMEKLVLDLDLDSLHRANLHQDSVEANLFFYEQAFESYRERFPGVDKPAFMRIARGQDQEFCLFRADPAPACLEIGDKFAGLGLSPQARDAYEAGLLSEGVNGSKLNVQLWARLATLHFESEEFDKGKPYLSKVLEVEPSNRQAKKLLASAARQKYKG